MLFTVVRSLPTVSAFCHRYTSLRSTITIICRRLTWSTTYGPTNIRIVDDPQPAAYMVHCLRAGHCQVRNADEHQPAAYMGHCLPAGHFPVRNDHQSTANRTTAGWQDTTWRRMTAVNNRQLTLAISYQMTATRGRTVTVISP
ncbi:hypothetical protein DPMN_012607 [Dreissena polymorpha]|uniref:Uncharacterized protein n=1 Tax=Dreissena polymorpha TaxID=45954 RepID=A0A9D4S133_DREPO|nr:hypothetical protein DPMN_012607 [Dreissena polymorpha]